MKLPRYNPEHIPWYILASALLIVLLVWPWAANAHYWHGDHEHGDTVININDEDTDGCMCVTGGVSDSDLSRGLSLAMSAGAHELDFSTQDWQLSMTYALQVNEDDEGAGSVKLGKRWDRFANVLMHVTYVPEQGQDYGDWVIVGGTFRF